MNKKATKIIKSTINLFLAEGVEKITMNRISANARTSKATVYKYFIDKDTLYFEISKYLLSNIAERYLNIELQSEPLIKKFYSFIEAVCEFTDCGHYNLCKVLATYNTDINTIFEHYNESYEKSMMGLIKNGFNDKLIKSEMDKNIVYSYIDMSIQYYQNNDKYRFRMNNDEKFQKEFMLFLLGNIFNTNLIE